jgi:hypothetical protein
VDQVSRIAAAVGALMWDEPEKPTTVYVTNPDDEALTIKIAKEISAKTRGTITVKRPDGSVIAIVSSINAAK